MNRIKELRKANNMTQSELAKKLKVAQNTLSTWENGKYEPDNNALGMLSEFFGVTTDYLLGLTNNIPTQSVRNRLLVPVLGDVAAGIPIEAIQNIVDYEEIDTAMAATGEFFGLRLKGGSMEPRMRDGDVVIIRKQDDADTGDTAVVLVNGDSATVKRIKKEPSGISLIPNNPAYDTMFYSCDEIQRLPVQIIGKVVELRAKF